MFKKVNDPEKRKFTMSETILLVVMSLLIGISIGALLLSKTNIITKTSTIKNKNLQELIQNYDYIINNYYEKVDERKLVDGAISGMMESLEDEYSVYMDPTQSENFSITLDGSYKGIGVQIVQDEETGNIIVASVFKNSPAHESGLLPGDQITKIDGVKSSEYTVEEFSSLIRESDKDKFILEVLRDNEKKLISGAINGMMQELDDPYSVYFNQNESENFSITLDGSYKGVGIQILKNEEDGSILITAVFKNSPASKAGLKVGDTILEFDGVSVEKYSADEFSKIVKSDDKEKFKLKILRDQEEKTITLEKSLVTLDSVTSEIYEINNKKIGYIYIGIFANNSYYQFKDILDELEKEKIDSLIIDVRGNSGGHLTSVDSILDIFLTSKQKMYGFEQNGKRTYTYGTGATSKKYEIVLLGDENSASASEVLIAGLKENLGSKFFGKKTFGKGTVQEMISLTDGAQYKITIKKWLTPNGNWINDTDGIIPDKEIELSEKYYETLKEDDDTQLNYAIEYLSNK